MNNNEKAIEKYVYTARNHVGFDDSKVFKALDKALAELEKPEKLTGGRNE